MLLKIILLVKKYYLGITTFLFIHMLVLFSCTGPDKRVINIACASNLQFVLPVLIEEYLKISLNPDIKIEISFGSSGKLASQIKEGAPFNLFLAANIDYPDKLYKDGHAINPPKVYAIGKLILFKPKGALDDNNFIDELSFEKNLVAIPNPALAPYGKAVFQFLDKINLKISDKRILLADNIGTAIHYCLSGSNLGFISYSALHSEELIKYKNTTSFIILPESSYDPIRQGLVIVNYGNLQTEIDSLVLFLFSEFGQNIFKSYGYSRGERYAVH